MQNFQALGAPPPDPRASGGWELCPQTAPPHCEFLTTRLTVSTAISKYHMKWLQYAALLSDDCTITQLFAMVTEKACFATKKNACNENSARQLRINHVIFLS